MGSFSVSVHNLSFQQMKAIEAIANEWEKSTTFTDNSVEAIVSELIEQERFEEAIKMLDGFEAELGVQPFTVKLRAEISTLEFLADDWD